MIDFDLIKEIFPNQLPPAHIFFATQDIIDMGITYHTIRSFTKYRTTNRGAWLRFLKAYAEHETVVKDYNVMYANLDVDESDEGLTPDSETYGEYFAAAGAIMTLRLRADPDYETAFQWQVNGIEPSVWEHVLVINGVDQPGLVVHIPPDSSISLASELFEVGHKFKVELSNKYPAGSQLYIQCRVNGRLSNPVFVTVSNETPVTELTLASVVGENYSADGTGFDDVIIARAFIPQGLEDKYTWGLSLRNPLYADTVYGTPRITVDPRTGGPMVEVMAFPVGNWKGEDTEVVMFGSPKGSETPIATMSGLLSNIVGIPEDHSEYYVKSVHSFQDNWLIKDGIVKVARNDKATIPLTLTFERNKLPAKAHNRLEEDPRGPRFRYVSSSPDFSIPEFAFSPSPSKQTQGNTGQLSNTAGPVTLTVSDVSSDVPEDLRAAPLTLAMEPVAFAATIFPTINTRYPNNAGCDITLNKDGVYELNTYGLLHNPDAMLQIILDIEGTYVTSDPAETAEFSPRYWHYETITVETEGIAPVVSIGSRRYALGLYKGIQLGQDMVIKSTIYSSHGKYSDPVSMVLRVVS